MPTETTLFAATTRTTDWWSFLCVVSAINVLAWLVSAVVLKRRHSRAADGTWLIHRPLLLLSGAYVLGCAYRSVLPVFDVPRLVLVDTWLSSVIVGRSVATLAEVCFAAQWAILLHTASRHGQSRLGMRLATAIVPLIVVAETFSWYSVLTTSNLGHVIEESLWGICAVLLAIGVSAIWSRSHRELRLPFTVFIVAACAYAGYMFSVDVPMYWARWVVDEAASRQYLTLSQGVVDASVRWVVSHRWDDWKSEVVWMSLYFSVAVWLSIGLAHVRLRPVGLRITG